MKFEVIFIITILFLLSLILYTLKYRTKTIKQDIKLIKAFFEIIENYKENYFTNTSKIKLLDTYKDLYNKFEYGKFRFIRNKDIEEFKNTYKELDILVKQWNELYIEKELIKNNDLLNNIDGKSLDYQQRKAIIVDEDNNLILAGAGSGKTLTISGKVKYLVETKGIDPKEILLISFTKKAANEIDERINNRLGINIKATTFHKLGLDIITKYKGIRLDVSERLNKSIDGYFKSVIYKDVESIDNLVLFFGYYINVPKNIELFEDLGKYYTYCNSLDFTTLKGKQEIEKYNRNHENIYKLDKKTIKGEQVKSIEEVIIANYLYLNGVDYVYEDKYKYKIKDKFRKQYRPDFYLPDYDIYIEHFGINRDYKVPWLSSIEEQKYIDGIKWKRELHIENGTNLIETYSYYNEEGILLEKLKEELDRYNVKFKEVEYYKIYEDIIASKEDKYFKEFRKLIATFIGLFKSNGYTLDGFDILKKDANKIDNKFLRERSILFLDVVKSVYINYENELLENEEIDFNDMINEATDIVKNASMEFNYKYIIIDEYQDISKSRFNLINEIKKQTNAKLICVGDDWQSIYRFTGSDIDLFTNFGKYVGYYELLKIEKTYRNSQELIDIAGNYIMKNRNQLTKSLKSDKKNNQPIKMICYTDNICNAMDASIDDIVNKFGINSEITILGRNNFDINVLSESNSNGKYRYLKKNEDIIVKCNKYPNLKINYLTVHKSKGFECDNIIILNLENKVFGFPNQMVDDPVLDLVLTESDNFDFAEERRLFYVAITRSRNTTYLLIPKYNSSIFCDELIKEFNLSVENIDLKDEKNIYCPKCTSGHLLKRNSNNGSKFLGCSNYPICNFTSNAMDILENPIDCELCKGYMVKREKNGEYFLGCTNYPYCKNTKKYNYEDNYIKSEDIISSDEIEQCNKDTFYYDTCEEFEKIELEYIMDEIKHYNTSENTKTYNDKKYDLNEEELNKIYGIEEEELYDYYIKELEMQNDYNGEEKNDKININNIVKDIVDKENFYDVLLDINNKETLYLDRVEDNELINNLNKLQDKLLNIINKETISKEKKLWIEGFIYYIHGEILTDLFSTEELNKIIICNKLIRDEWILSDIDYIEIDYFYSYKSELYELEKEGSLIQKHDMKSIKIYIKYNQEDSYEYYKTCKLADINYENIKDIIEYKDDFIIKDIFINSIFIEFINLNNNELENNKINSIHSNEKLELYINKGLEKYKFYKSCFTEVNLKIGDIISDIGNNLEIIDIKDNTIYLKLIELSIENINITQNRIVTMYIDSDSDCIYYKKYITNIIYRTGDLFEDGEKQFIISNIFKDTVFLKYKLDNL